jgi:hypothetical protein
MRLGGLIATLTKASPDDRNDFRVGSRPAIATATYVQVVCERAVAAGD